jgi:hypothetical protein
MSAIPNLSFIKAAPIEPNGRINMGLSGIAAYSTVYPFLNVWKCGGPLEIVADGDGNNYRSNIAPGSANSAWDGFLDQSGELANPFGGSATRLTRTIFAVRPDGNPEGFNRIGERWVLKWDGTASDVFIAGSSSSTRFGNRIEWTWGRNTPDLWVTFKGMVREDPPRNIRLCEARYEARLDAGELFNPEWLSKIREGSGIVRFMGWQGTNFDISTLRFSDIPDGKYFSYGGDATKPGIKGGAPIALMSALANQVGSHPWVCVPNVLGTNKLSAIASISNARLGVVSSPGHQWEVGDRVIPYGTNWPQVERNTYTVVNSDQQAGTLALSDVDSTGFDPFASTSASLTAPYDLDSIAKEVALFSAHFRDNVRRDLVTYFELGNELWNSLFNAQNWLAAQARSKFAGDDSNKMAGYLAAHCMKTIRDTYGAENRRRWKGILATQTVNTYVTNAVIEGARHYIQESAPSLTLSDLFDDLAVTGYWGGSFIEAHISIVCGWMDLSESRWLAGREPAKYSYFNRMVNEDCTDSRHTGIPYSLEKLAVFWLAQKIIADAHGLGLIQYEGGNGNSPEFFGNLTAAERARFIEFYKHCNHTFEDADNYTAMFKKFLAIGGKYPSKFVDMGPVSRHGAWGGLRYLGDSNPVWDAVVTFNGRH